MKNLAILGSTGSIGTQTIQTLPYIDAKVWSLTTNKNIELLEKQARQLRPKLVCAFDKDSAEKLKENLADTRIEVYSGMEGLIKAVTVPEVDTVVTAVVGMIGLIPTIKAIESKKNIALANKETLVCAGEIVIKKAAEYGVKILPVDSEHSAIFQCLQGAGNNKINKIILTASGGPFFGMTLDEVQNMKKENALKHPNWSMGAKITIDSATMMNKGLEFIEAMWLYGVSPEQIEIVIHRESIVHSAIEFCDGAVIAQLGVPDMRLPIQYALTYPERKKCPSDTLSLSKIAKMTFFEPDYSVFECLNLAIYAAKKKGNAGAVLNGANEAAVMLFLQDKIGFCDIPKLVRKALDCVEYIENITIENVIESDAKARKIVFDKVGEGIF